MRTKVFLGLLLGISLGFAAEMLAPAEGLKLTAEFKKAQKTELRAFEYRQKAEWKELKASQAAREKEWLKAETQARHAYFAQKPAAPQKREYVQSYRERWKALRLTFNDERTKKLHDQAEALRLLQETQAKKFHDFEELVKKGEKPPTDLWPQLSQ